MIGFMVGVTIHSSINNTRLETLVYDHMPSSRSVTIAEPNNLMDRLMLETCW